MVSIDEMERVGRAIVESESASTLEIPTQTGPVEAAPTVTDQEPNKESTVTPPNNYNMSVKVAPSSSSSAPDIAGTGVIQTISIDSKAVKTVEPQNDQSKTEVDPNAQAPSWYIVLVVFCMAGIYANSLTYRFTITQTGKAEYILGENGTWVSLSMSQDSSLVVPVAALVGLVPTVIVYGKSGFRPMFIFAMVLSLLSSALMPLAHASLAFTIIVRALQGLSLTSFVPLIAKTASFVLDSAFFSLIVFSFMQFAPMLAYPIGGILCHSVLGWHAVHYAVALIALVLFVALLIYYRKPSLQRLFRQHELARIFMGGSSKEAKAVLAMEDVPYMSIYQDPHVWAMFLGAFGYFSALQLAVQYGPVFIHRVLGYSIVATGFLSALPQLFIIGIAFTATVIVENVESTEEKWKIRTSSLVSQLVPGLLFILQAVIHNNQNQGFVLAFFIIAVSMLGSSYTGFFRMCAYVSGRLHVFLLANLFAVNLVAMFLTSLANILIVHSDFIDEWKTTFYLHGGVLVITSLVFCFLASADAAQWSQEGYEDTSRQPRRDDPLPQFPL